MISIHPLKEGPFTIGFDKIFYPFDPKTEELTDRPRGSLLVDVQPFVIVCDNDIILLDTGLGFKDNDGKYHIEHSLKEQGFETHQITKILFSHLHKDHAGGLKPELFPNATLYVYENELKYAEEIGFPSYYPDELKFLHDYDKVVFLNGKEGVINDRISWMHTNGHSPEHIVFKIQSEEGIIFYGGDEAPTYHQLKYRYVAKYDFDGRKAAELREQWAAQGKKENWTFLFYHDVKSPIVKVQ